MDCDNNSVVRKKEYLLTKRWIVFGEVWCTKSLPLHFRYSLDDAYLLQCWKDNLDPETGKALHLR